jgi:hypothetical protein
MLGSEAGNGGEGVLDPAILRIIGLGVNYSDHSLVASSLRPLARATVAAARRRSGRGSKRGELAGRCRAHKEAIELA